ncbi:MAG: DedA family protein [Bacteroidaceae bacterium]|nr:DedA family protein [Bacteroidaceae bacterium]
MDGIILEFFKDYGYLGMGILSFLSGTVVPITSEVLLVFFLNLGLNAVGITLVATLGNTLGGITCFLIGYLTTKERAQKFFKISDKKMRRADKLIQKYGYWTAGISFVPIFGEALLVTLGVMRVDRYKVIAVMATGKLIRYAFITVSYTGLSALFEF